MCYFLLAQWILIERVSCIFMGVMLSTLVLLVNFKFHLKYKTLKRKKNIHYSFDLYNLKLFGRDEFAEKETAGLLSSFLRMCS